jgi:AcrR family transcriptional regulator
VATAKRMLKEQRRAQLLKTALEIVREEGTEALTLAHLAERAGVTKPIAYEHFGTRAGLLIAIFRDYDDRTTDAVRAALAAGGKTVDAVASILSVAYVETCLKMGPEVTAVFDALAASEETESFRQAWRDFLVEEFRKGFAPLVKLPKKQMEAILLGILGAAATLSQEAAAGRLSRNEAVNALTRITAGAFKP